LTTAKTESFMRGAYISLKLSMKPEQKHKPQSFSHPYEEIRGTRNGSLVHRFITSGKPGKCELCPKFVKKLEEHHVQYRPEKTIKACHDCHHKTHFWPLRLSEEQKYKMLKLIRPEKEARQLAADKTLTNIQLAKLIAPSRSGFVRAQQKSFAETGEMRVTPVARLAIRPGESPGVPLGERPISSKTDVPKFMFKTKKHL